MQETKSVEVVPDDAPQPSWRAVLRNRNFRLLWFGEGISLLGDQFYMIALPWLVLQLTGDGLAMGTVLAVTGIPRALFMLVGGAITDRYSPRSVMLASNLARMTLVGLLAAVTLIGVVELWMLYALALAFGLADAFFFPASSAIVPQIVDKDNLQSGNALIMGTAQLSIFAGPALAGLLIALLGGRQAAAAGETAAPGLQGIGLAFAFDTLTFLASVVTLALMRVRPTKAPMADDQDSVLAAISEGIRVVWRDRALRIIFVIAAGVNLLFTGPFVVGIPYLADTRFAEGSVAFGTIMSAFGGGMLLGNVLAGMLPRLPVSLMGTLLMSVVTALGVGIALIGLVETTALAASVALGMGIANGYVNIYFVTWLQSRAPVAMLGRVMSLLSFASLGLVPVSNAVAGALLEVHTTGLFVVSGGLLALLTLSSMLNPAVRAMGVEPVTES